MRLAQTWIGVDVIATRYRGRIVVHSSGGQRSNAVLKRIAPQLGLDRDGEALLTNMINAELAPIFEAWDSPDYDPLALGLSDQARTEGNLEWRTHWVPAPDGQPVGLIVWLAEGPVPAPPVYNSWILDLDAVTTQSGGDNIALIGTDRQVGEPRPIRDLLQWVNAIDAAGFLGLYWDAATAPKGTVAEAPWSVKPPGATDWVHFWSAAHAGLGPTDRTVYGMSVQLTERSGIDITLRQIAQFGRNTLILFDSDQLFVVHAAGALRDALGDENIADLVGQVHHRDLGTGSVELVVTIDGHRYEASAWHLPSVQRKPGRPAAIALRPLDDDGAVA
ncbi:hypothetical protein ACWEVD_01045 [Nocardia thailandica]